MLTQKEILDKFKISRCTLYKMIKAGKFPAPLKTGTRKLFWREADIEKYIESLEPRGE